jgi:phosphonate transport system permease protein
MSIAAAKRGILDGFIFSYLMAVILFLAIQPSEEMMLNLQMNFFGFLVLFLIGFGVSSLLNSKEIKTLGELIFQPPEKRAKAVPQAFLKSFWGWELLLFLLVTLVVGAVVTQFSIIELLDVEGIKGAGRLFYGLSHPNWSLLPRAVLNIIQTVYMAFMATALAIPLAFVLCFFAAKNIMQGKVAFIIYLVLRTLLNVTRSIEALIWAIIFSVWVGIGPFAGMMALMIHSIASLTKQYSEIVESVSDGPIEGILSTGASKLQVIWFAIVPQVVLPFISFTVYRWDINIRMATIIGLVGGGGIGTMLIQYQGQAMWPEVGTIIFVIAVVVWVMDTASAYLREALK